MKADEYEKPFKNYPSIKTFLIMPFAKETAKSTWALLYSAWKNFFVLQTKQKLHIKNLPVISVDHEIDKKIPFIPKNVKIYLDFVWFFCRIISMFIKKLSWKNASKVCTSIVDFIKTLYDNASTIYNHALSTTERPHYYGTPKFIIIHLFDPHYLCVPSLHVAIVVGVYAKIKQIFNTMAEETKALSEEEKKQILDSTFYGTKAITESVLYVKQHSVNCVAGALYLLSSAYKTNDYDFFPEQEANFTIDSLFKNDDQISFECATEIRTYIKSLYTTLQEQNKNNSTWQQPLWTWLDSYKG